MFALASGRGSVVVGLFIVEDGNPTDRVINDFDAERWPWSVKVQPVASVDPVDAIAVEGVRSPRTPPTTVDAQYHTALYAALVGATITSSVSN
jgi:hypothetical protein